MGRLRGGTNPAQLYSRADAYRRLGLRNIADVAMYRMQLGQRVHPVQRIRRSIGGECFFRRAGGAKQSLQPAAFWMDDARYFGWYRTPLHMAEPPDWFANPFTSARVTNVTQPWWQISDFETGAGDIKTIWEASRFDWVLPFAQRAAQGDDKSLERLNVWLGDWCLQNPAFCGPNWKCGQEAALRVLHLAVAAKWLEQIVEPERDLVRLIDAHLARIYPTLRYALAQDNNHGTSEAAALFVGGTWLSKLSAGRGPQKRSWRLQAARWAGTGRRWLEERVARLVTADGSFSQHSVNYHRLMLDTLSLSELWRRWLRLPRFSIKFYERAAAATRWLHAMTNRETGNTPILGANDGANLLPITDADYLDYRPAVCLAGRLFAIECADYPTGFHESHLRWLEVDESTESPLQPAFDDVSEEPKSKTVPRVAPVFHAAGYHVVNRGPWRIIFRYPHFRFRPGHCDALHVDLWWNSINLLRDAGTYSYNHVGPLDNYFSSVNAHNTIQFDDRDQMPAVSRFLRGHWLQAHGVKCQEHRSDRVLVAAGYRDWRGAEHHREVDLVANGMRVVDRVKGFHKRAILRWRLAPGEWTLVGTTLRRATWYDHTHTDHERSPRSAYHELNVQASMPILSCELVQGWESRYYLQKSPVPVLEITVEQPGDIVTEYQIK